MIGQFGVGFYASFMVSQNVEVCTRKAGEKTAWKWTSDGRSGFNIEKITKDVSGTEVKLKIKDDAKEFLEASRVQFVVKKYSDHISYPVKFIEIDKKDSRKKQSTKPLLFGQSPLKM